MGDLGAEVDLAAAGDRADLAAAPDLGRDSCATRALCEDFEGAAAGGPPDRARWTVSSPNCSGSGALAIDDIVAHGGGRSLKVSGKGGYCNHVFAANSAAIATLQQETWGRYYVRFGQALGNDHVTFLAMKDAADHGKDLRQGGQSQILMWNRESDDATLPELSPAGIALSVMPTPNDWHCVEFLVNGPAGKMQTWFDGAEVIALREDQSPTPDVDTQWLRAPNWHPVLADFRIGWESYGGTDMTLWFDDVALDSTRIGCP
jgi:hypothetical protein